MFSAASVLSGRNLYLRQTLFCSFFVCIALFCGYGSLRCAAQEGARPAPTPVEQKKTDETPAHKYFTDTLLINQNGEKMRFYSDLLKGKVVVINTFFSTCEGSCPVMTRNLAKIQDALGERFGRDVYFVSISVDPTMDTPARLKAYARKYNAKPGWNFMTGDEQNVDLALKKLGQVITAKEDHSNIFYIGNERTGLWKKAFGLGNSDELVKVIESVLDDKGDGPAPSQPKTN